MIGQVNKFSRGQDVDTPNFPNAPHIASSSVTAEYTVCGNSGGQNASRYLLGCARSHTLFSCTGGAGLQVHDEPMIYSKCLRVGMLHERSFYLGLPLLRGDEDKPVQPVCTPTGQFPPITGPKGATPIRQQEYSSVQLDLDTNSVPQRGTARVAACAPSQNLLSSSCPRPSLRASSPRAARRGAIPTAGPALAMSADERRQAPELHGMQQQAADNSLDDGMQHHMQQGFKQAAKKPQNIRSKRGGAPLYCQVSCLTRKLLSALDTSKSFPEGIGAACCDHKVGCCPLLSTLYVHIVGCGGPILCICVITTSLHRALCGPAPGQAAYRAVLCEASGAPGPCVAAVGPHGRPG